MLKEKTILQFSCAQQRLNQALTTVSRAVCKSSIDIEKMPLLGCIRMQVKDGFLILGATNLDISITVRVELEQKNDIQEGVVAIPAKWLTDLVSKMQGSLSLTLAENYMLHLVHAHGNASLKCLNAEMYMPIPDAQDGEKPVLLPVVPLKEIVKEVSIAAARDEGFPALTCLLVHVEKNRAVFAATDRYRTAHRVLPLQTAGEETYDLLIPARELIEIVSPLPNEGMVMMSVTPNGGQVIFHTQWITLSSRLLEGQFPNYTAAIPKERQSRVVVKTEEFKQIVQLTAPYANAGSSRAIGLSILGSAGMESGKLTVSSLDTEMGSGLNTIAAVVEGEDQGEIHFDCRFLLDSLSVISTSEVSFEIGLTKIKSISASTAIIKAVGQNTCLHSFMALANES
jgi:DNA polymerase-3 subunit beta